MRDLGKADGPGLRGPGPAESCGRRAGAASGRASPERPPPAYRANFTIAKNAPCGSVNTAKRPTPGMSMGGTMVLPPSF